MDGAQFHRLVRSVVESPGFDIGERLLPSVFHSEHLGCYCVFALAEGTGAFVKQ
jgi:hypothetical protein